MDLRLFAEATHSWQDVALVGISMLFCGFVAWLIFR
jgi:hypothetical protein